MSNSPGQVPNPMPQPQQPQPTPQGVSDKTIDAFMSAPQDKQREALGKMSEPTKQALLQGIKARKGVQTTPAQPPKPEGFIDKAKQFMGAGPAIPAKPLTDTEKKSPFESGVVSGSMLDPSKISQQPAFGGQASEVGRQMYEGAKNWVVATAKDPLHIADPVDAMVKGQADAYRKVRDGLSKGDHDLLMNGLGEAVGNLSVILGGAKTAEGPSGVVSSARDASFAAKDLTAKRAIVSAASHSALDALKDEHSQAIDTGVKAERARIGGNVEALNIKDVKADPKGYVPPKLAVATLDQVVSDKKATVLMNKRMLPKVAQVRGLLEGHTQNLTFNDLKQVRTIVGDALNKSTGVEKAILSDYYSSLTKNLKGRAAFLGGIKEWEDYNEGEKKLAGHEKGLIPELKDSKTGLEYAKKISSEQNQGRLSTLESDLKLPKGFFAKAVKDYKPITNFAKMSEGDSITAKTVNRLIALKQHPIAASLGGAAGVTLGKALGTAVGSPMAGSFIGLTLGAAFAHDLMSKYDAAKAIREIGGPSGVMGVRSQPPPSSQPPSGASPQQGPGGGGSPSPVAPPVNTLPGAPLAVNTINPKLRNLLDPKWVQEAKKGVSEADKGIEEAKQRIEDAKLGKNPKPGQGSNAWDKPDTRPTAEQEAGKAETENRAKAVEATKVAGGQHGREPSKRPGMTKDTPEARKAKAAERIAAKRSEASRTNIKTSLEDQARQVAGRMDFQGKSIPELEEGLQALYGGNGKRFMVEFKRIAKQQKWSEEVYRGYIEDTLDRRAKELAQRPNIPGLGTEPKVE